MISGSNGTIYVNGVPAGKAEWALRLGRTTADATVFGLTSKTWIIPIAFRFPRHWPGPKRSRYRRRRRGRA